MRGVASVRSGRDGQPTGAGSRQRPGMEPHTLFSPKARGHLGKQLTSRFPSGKCHPAGVWHRHQELWEVQPGTIPSRAWPWQRLADGEG